MHYYIFPYFIILVVILQLILRKNTRKMNKREADYYERERKANLVRRQDISKLDYITIPDDIFMLDETSSKTSSPSSIQTDFKEVYEHNYTVQQAYRDILTLRDKKILNLNGISNTDLKLQYGVANLATLTECDDNFSLLAKSLASIGHALLEEGRLTCAKLYLEYGVELRADIRSIYVDLAGIYKLEGSGTELSKLIDQVNSLESINRDIILEKLRAII